MFTDASTGRPIGISAGPDGNDWFANFESFTIGRIRPDGAVTSFSGTDVSEPSAVAAGSDGNMWFVNHSRSWTGSAGFVSRVSMAGNITSLLSTQGKIAYWTAIVPGPDGNLWYNNAGPGIGRITPAGDATMITLPAGTEASDLTAGPDAHVWFADHQGNAIGRVNDDGSVDRFTDATISEPEGIATGPTATSGSRTKSGNSIERITPSGSVVNFPSPLVTHRHHRRFRWWRARGTEQVGFDNAGPLAILVAHAHSAGTFWLPFSAKFVTRDVLFVLNNLPVLLDVDDPHDVEQNLSTSARLRTTLSKAAA